MARPLTNFQEPGFFSEIKESPSLYLLPGSVRVVGLIGTGKDTKSILQDSTTRSDTGTNHADALDNAVASITRVYSDSVFQYPTSSYSTSITGTVADTIWNVSAKTFKISVDGGTTQTVTFTGVDPIPMATVITQLNAGLTGVKAYATVGNKVCIISGDGTTGDGGKKIKILDGTTNSVFGFTEDAVASSINWKASFSSIDPNVRPLDTTVYYVDYESPKVAADFKPVTYFSLSQVSAAYGDPSNDNTLSLGAQGAFGNGCSIVVCRQLDPEYSVLSAEMTAALLDMEAQEIDVLVPMESDTTLWGLYLTHVSKMSSKLERKERRVILGVDETSARLPITGSGSWTTLMASFVSGSGLEPKRVEVINPGYALVTVKDQQITVDGTYAAACLAGLKCNPVYDTATPMTRKALSTIDSLLFPDLLRSEKNILTGLGVTVLEHRGAIVTVRRSITADASSVASQEPSIVFSFDQLSSELREALENRFVGTKITGGTKAAVEAATTTFLLRYVQDELIASFRNVRAEQNSVEPRQYDISFEALPIFPFLWGSLDITIVLR